MELVNEIKELLYSPAWLGMKPATAIFWSFVVVYVPSLIDWLIAWTRILLGLMKAESSKHKKTLSKLLTYSHALVLASALGLISGEWIPGFNLAVIAFVWVNELLSYYEHLKGNKDGISIALFERFNPFIKK